MVESRMIVTLTAMIEINEGEENVNPFMVRIISKIEELLRQDESVSDIDSINFEIE